MNFLKQRLQQRKSENTYRTLTNYNELIDFSSNDYLGLARNKKLSEEIKRLEKQYNTHKIGATGSRLISGNCVFAEQLEQEIADFHRAEKGLLFNSGYDANVGLFACLGKAGDTYISDELVHASIIDGIRLSKAKRLIFKHNDLLDLEAKLQEVQGNIFIIIEGIYSMDGDVAPLQAIVDLAKKYKAYIIIDEAHSTGILGKEGKGLVCKLGLEKEVFARIHTFGKAMGVHGAIVLGSADLRNYLINFCRSFIFTTALPIHALYSIKAAYTLLPTLENERIHLNTLIAFFKTEIQKIKGLQLLHSDSPIQGIVFENAALAKATAQRLLDNGIYAKAIVYPTVAKGKERLRICLHSFNTKEEILFFNGKLKVEN